MSNQSSNQQCATAKHEIRPAEDVLWHLREATREAEMLVRAGIIEVAVRNPSVADYMNHWEGRTTKAEAEVERLRDALDDAFDILKIALPCPRPWATESDDAKLSIFRNIAEDRRERPAVETAAGPAGNK